MLKRCVFLLLSCLLLSACQNTGVGVIGGADGPTKVIVSENNENSETPSSFERRAVRLIRLHDALYYDTGRVSDVTARCGVMDGNLAAAAEAYAVPQENGTCNFTEAKGYQFGTETDTIEVPLEDEWVIFKKIDASTDVLQYTKSAAFIGKLPNATQKSCFLVLSHEENITFDDAAYVLLGSDLSQMKDIYVLPLVDWDK